MPLASMEEDMVAEAEWSFAAKDLARALAALA